MQEKMSEPDGAGERTITNPQLAMTAGLIGLAGGLVAVAFHYVLDFGLHGVWGKWVGVDWKSLPEGPHWNGRLWAVAVAGGFLVGWVQRWLGKPGEIAAVVDNIHLERGRIDAKQAPAMASSALVSIIAGGSAGPEAPLVQIIGSFGSWVGDRMRLRGDLVRTLTFCGMATALGAFFGAPLGGALFALEIPHRRGLEYYEALLPAILAAVVGYMVFVALVGPVAPLIHLPGFAEDGLTDALHAVLLGVVGAGAAVLFVWLFKGIETLAHPLAGHGVLLATVGGACIGGIAQLFPRTLFWGEYQIDSLVNALPALSSTHTRGGLVALLLSLAVAKILATGFTLHGGLRGGFIFPLFFIGAAFGLAMSTMFPGIPVGVAVLCTMAAVNVAVTKTPVSTSVILVTLSSTAMLPAVVIASLTSFLLTTRVSLIRTQRSRQAVHGTEGSILAPGL